MESNDIDEVRDGLREEVQRLDGGLCAAAHGDSDTSEELPEEQRKTRVIKGPPKGRWVRKEGLSHLLGVSVLAIDSLEATEVQLRKREPRHGKVVMYHSYGSLRVLMSHVEKNGPIWGWTRERLYDLYTFIKAWFEAGHECMPLTTNPTCTFDEAAYWLGISGRTMRTWAGEYGMTVLDGHGACGADHLVREDVIERLVEHGFEDIPQLESAPNFPGRR